MSWAKPGKHGHAKAFIAGYDIFTDKRYEDSCPTSHNVDIPVVARREYSLIGISEDAYVSLLTPEGTTKEDLKLPEETDELRDVK